MSSLHTAHLKPRIHSRTTSPARSVTCSLCSVPWKPFMCPVRVYKGCSQTKRVPCRRSIHGAPTNSSHVSPLLSSDHFPGVPGLHLSLIVIPVQDPSFFSPPLPSAFLFLYVLDCFVHTLFNHEFLRLRWERVMLERNCIPLAPLLSPPWKHRLLLAQSREAPNVGLQRRIHLSSLYGADIIFQTL